MTYSSIAMVIAMRIASNDLKFTSKKLNKAQFLFTLFCKETRIAARKVNHMTC